MKLQLCQYNGLLSRRQYYPIAEQNKLTCHLSWNKVLYRRTLLSSTLSTEVCCRKHLGSNWIPNPNLAL